MALDKAARRKLALTLVGEASGEGATGMEAVAWVIRNRANSGKFPSNPVDVVMQGDGTQFQTWSKKYGNHPELMAEKNPAVYAQALKIVDHVFNAPKSQDTTKNALYYYNPRTADGPPVRGPQYQVTAIGNHHFLGDANYIPESTKRVFQDQSGVRDLGLSTQLVNTLTRVGDKAGVYFEVKSGGQTDVHDAATKEVTWTGSTRHDNGNAADVRAFTLNPDGSRNYLDFNTKEGRAKWSDIVSFAASEGITGVGAGDGYMGSDTVHLGYGDVAVWGGTANNHGPTPEWLRTAFDEGRMAQQALGIFANQPTSYPVPLPRPGSTPQAEQPVLAKLPSGNYAPEGTYPGSNPGTTITIKRGPDGNAIITQNNPGIFNLAKMGSDTIIGKYIEDQLKAANVDLSGAQGAIDAAATAKDAIQAAVPGVGATVGNAVTDFAMGFGSFLTSNKDGGTKTPAKPETPQSVPAKSAAELQMERLQGNITGYSYIRDLGPAAVKEPTPSGHAGHGQTQTMVSPGVKPVTPSINAPNISAAELNHSMLESWRNGYRAIQEMGPQTPNALPVPRSVKVTPDGTLVVSTPDHNPNALAATVSHKSPGDFTVPEPYRDPVMNAALRDYNLYLTNFASRTNPQAPVSVAETRAEQALSRAYTKTVSVQVQNPDYAAWEKQYGIHAVAPTVAETRAEQAQQRAYLANLNAPPPPDQYITVQKEITIPQGPTTRRPASRPAYVPPPVTPVKLASGTVTTVGARTPHGGVVQADGSIKFGADAAPGYRNRTTPGPGSPKPFWQQVQENGF